MFPGSFRVFTGNRQLWSSISALPYRHRLRLRSAIGDALRVCMWRADSRVARAAHGGAFDACFPQGQIRFSSWSQHCPDAQLN